MFVFNFPQFRTRAAHCSPSHRTQKIRAHAHIADVHTHTHGGQLAGAVRWSSWLKQFAGTVRRYTGTRYTLGVRSSRNRLATRRVLFVHSIDEFHELYEFDFRSSALHEFASRSSSPEVRLSMSSARLSTSSDCSISLEISVPTSLSEYSDQSSPVHNRIHRNYGHFRAFHVFITLCVHQSIIFLHYHQIAHRVARQAKRKERKSGTFQCFSMRIASERISSESFQ